MDRAYLNVPVNQFGPLLVWNESSRKRAVDAAFAVLAHTGVGIRHAGYLDELADRGARVDRTRSVVRFDAQDLEQTIDVLRATSPVPTKRPGPLRQKRRPARLGVGSGANQLFDWDRWAALPATRATLRQVCHWANGCDKIVRLSTPLHLHGTGGRPLLETLEGYALMARWCCKPVFHSFPLVPLHVKYLARMERAVADARGYRPTMPAMEWVSLPLKIDPRALDTLLAAFDQGVCDTLGFGTMTVSGMSAPVTVAGACVTGLAEVLGALSVLRILRPGAKLATMPATGQMDMDTGRVQYYGFRALRQNMAFAELMRGLGVQVDFLTFYREANEPGLQACYEMAMAATFFKALKGGGSPGLGSLACSNLFSPEQAVMDAQILLENLDLFSDFDTSEAALGLEAILDAGFESDTFLTHDHTLGRYRDELPLSRFFFRGLTAGAHHDRDRTQTDELLAQAHEACVAQRAAGAQLEPDDGLADELDSIVREAAGELGVEPPPPGDAPV